MASIDEEIQKLIDQSFFIVEKALNESGVYDPFAITINEKGEIIPFTYDRTEEDDFDSEQIIEELDAVLDAQLENKEIRAYGVGYEVTIEINEKGDTSKALVLDLIHEEDERVPFYFFPYSLENDTVEFGESFGIEK